MSGIESKELQAELRRIAPDYQEAFRETLLREARAAEKDQTDSDILAYLRQRHTEFQNGDYIQPDGKPATALLAREQMYDQALGTITRDVVGDQATGAERRTLLLKGGVFALLIFAVAAFVFAGQRSRAAAQEGTPTPTGEATAAAALPTPTLLAPGGADAALQTIGGLGGSLTLGRPGALEIHYTSGAKVVALPIDPARISSKGELPYDAAQMRSDSPVAVWVFGTVLNYALGLPPHLVTALSVGDRLRLHTDTGATLAFVIVETGVRASHETNALLSQDRVGATLFALPAPDAAAVPVALAGYDLAAEEAGTAVSQQVDAPFGAGNGMQLTAVTYAHTDAGDLAVTVTGKGMGEGTLALYGASQQTTAVTIPAADPWQVEFTLPGSMVGEGMTAVYRQPLTGASAFIQLGTAPDLVAEQLDVAAPTAYWQPATGEVVVTVVASNPGPGLVRLPADYIQIVNGEGGDAYRAILMRPIWIAAGERVAVTVSFPHAGAEVPALLQIGEWLWRVTALQP